MKARKGITNGELLVKKVQFVTPVELDYETMKFATVKDFFIKLEYPMVKLTSKHSRNPYFVPFTNISCLDQQRKKDRFDSNKRSLPATIVIPDEDVE